MPGPNRDSSFFSVVARHKAAKCRDGALCKGPGCRVSNGKTARARANYHTRQRAEAKK